MLCNGRFASQRTALSARLFFRLLTCKENSFITSISIFLIFLSGCSREKIRLPETANAGQTDSDNPKKILRLPLSFPCDYFGNFLKPPNERDRIFQHPVAIFRFHFSVNHLVDVLISVAAFLLLAALKILLNILVEKILNFGDNPS